MAGGLAALKTGPRVGDIQPIGRMRAMRDLRARKPVADRSILPGGLRQGSQTFSRRCSRSHGLMTCRNSSYSVRLTEA